MGRRKGGTAVAVTAAVLVGTAGAAGCTQDTTGFDGREEAGGAALTAARSLPVKGHAPKTGYDRDRFGSPWADTDSNSCGTRVISVLRAVMDLFSQRMQGVVGCA